MKAAHLYICTVFATCLLSACNESHRDFSDYTPSLTAAPFITPSQTQLTFTSAASQQTITITSNCTWTVSASQEWVHVSVDATGNKVVVKADENTTYSQRQATITFTGEEGKTATIDVEQEACTSIPAVPTSVPGVYPDSHTIVERTSYSVNNNGRNVSFNMIRVGAGTFQMGSDSDWIDEEPVHQVTLTKDFLIGETEVTQSLWFAVMGQSPSSNGYFWDSEFGLDDNYPAYNISYEDCQKFLTKLNQLTGQQFRFPTEAEWEFAARGGTKSKGYTYAGSNTIDEVAWYVLNSWDTSHPYSGIHTVKTKKANELGLYDMSGNVYEWCADWYNSSLSGGTDPTGPTTGSYRVIRGGSWLIDAASCTVSSRSSVEPSYRGPHLGFRLAL